jgi:hypothetical protein
MNNQFERMQKLAGLITEGVGAYEYEKGKEAGEKAEKKKMKKSELKKQIKEMILAEIDIDLSNDDNFYDPVAEAKKKKKDEEEETEEVTIDDTEIDADEMDMGAEMPAVPAATDVQKELMDALEAAKASGDEKLVRQIGNALTYFTRSQVSKEEVPSMNEGMEVNIDPVKLNNLASEIKQSGIGRSDKRYMIEIVSLLKNNELAKAAEAIQLLDTSPNEFLYELMDEVYPELWDMLFDDGPEGYIALATPKAGLPEVLSPEYIDRMEGLANIQDLAVLKAKLRMLSSDWMQEGFEKEDIVEYISELINQI